MDKYMRISREGLWDLTDQLVEKLPKNYFDGIMCVARGGLFLGRVLGDMLELPLSIIYTERYNKGETNGGELKIHGVISPKPIQGNILLVDDLVDKGFTLLEIKKRYEACAPAVKEMKTAVYFKKPESIFIPDYYIDSTDKWIIFPYEKKEFEGLE